jgi:hypothetical protein
MTLIRNRRARRQTCHSTAIQRVRDRERHDAGTAPRCRAYIGKLEAVIQRQGDGFQLDESRVAYL